ncbi:hypothetical protein EYF80_008514 [Liparis tanakae]|uniref:Uncharacterized protein n=1 Tax=Liparis tanakae TaxID=230148 RepID=A0A4Z2IT68_9TELE|nr:hypothetical protein EYF80_008514 [Liparis tanakae]
MKAVSGNTLLPNSPLRCLPDREEQLLLAHPKLVHSTSAMLLEGDELPHPVRPRGGRVRVDVEPAGHGGLCLPALVMIISVPTSSNFTQSSLSCK